ncbi:DNA/RNA polymerase, partial [Caulochytrium protostelioides]
MLDRVRTTIEQEARDGHDLARLALPRLNRKLVKQTVMTNTYGVTPYGARQQITNRLREGNAKIVAAREQLKHRLEAPDSDTGAAVVAAEETDAAAGDRTEMEVAQATEAAAETEAEAADRVRDAEFLTHASLELLDKDKILPVATYVTAHIFQSLGVMFKGAQALQKWLNFAAMAISKSAPAEFAPESALDDLRFVKDLGVELPPHLELMAVTAIAEADSDAALARDGPLSSVSDAAAAMASSETGRALLDAALEDVSKTLDPSDAFALCADDDAQDGSAAVAASPAAPAPAAS